jgi:hypothetical protein
VGIRRAYHATPLYPQKLALQFADQRRSLHHYSSYADYKPRNFLLSLASNLVGLGSNPDLSKMKLRWDDGAIIFENISFPCRLSSHRIHHSFHLSIILVWCHIVLTAQVPSRTHLPHKEERAIGKLSFMHRTRENNKRIYVKYDVCVYITIRAREV